MTQASNRSRERQALLASALTITLLGCSADASDVAPKDSISQAATYQVATSGDGSASHAVFERASTAQFAAPDQTDPGAPPMDEGVPGVSCGEQLTISGPFTSTSSIVGGLRYTLFENIDGPAKSLSLNFRSNETGLLHLGAEMNQDVDTCEQCVTFFDPVAGEFWVSDTGFLDVSPVTPPLSGSVEVDLIGVRLRLAAAAPSEGPVEGIPSNGLPPELCISNVTLSGSGGAGCEDESCEPEPNRPRPRPREVTYEADIQPLLSRNCAGAPCHSAASPYVTLVNVDLTTLIDTASTQVPALDYITPGNSGASYLWIKLAGSAGIVNNQMPLGAPAFDQATLDLVADWIDAGAP